jgi:uncharacterized protein YutE (UPF0331/DUF86 family)
MLAEHLSDLRAAQPADFDEYQRNKILRGYVERTLQVCVQICLDVGTHLIAEYGFRHPEDNRDVFTVLKEEDVISLELHLQLRKMAGFRNIIVHDYARIDDALVYDILQKHLADMEEFADAVANFIESP